MSSDDDEPRRNLVLYGPQHSGKSSVINTTIKMLSKDTVALPMDVGNTANRGTKELRVGLVYVALVQSKSIFSQIAQLPRTPWNIEDTAGWLLGSDTAKDERIIMALSRGLKRKTNLTVEASWSNPANRKRRNKADAWGLVVNGEHLVSRTTRTVAHTESKMIFWTRTTYSTVLFANLTAQSMHALTDTHPRAGDRGQV